MEIKEFSEKIRNELQNRFGENINVRVQQVKKNNDTVLTGLMASRVDEFIAPTIYCEALYESYNEGEPLSVIVDKLEDFFLNNMPSKYTLGEDFFSFEKSKDKICVKLVGKDSNKTIMDECPYYEYLDLLICFYCLFENPVMGRGSILINNEHLKNWGVTKEEVYELAMKNTQRLLGQLVVPINKMIEDISGVSMPETEAIKVVSNNDKYFGASAILYDGLLGKISKEMNGDFYVIPSSIHECICMPCAQEAGYMKQIIREVNENELKPEEVLSYSLYYYNSTQNRLELA